MPDSPPSQASPPTNQARRPSPCLTVSTILFAVAFALIAVVIVSPARFAATLRRLGLHKAWNGAPISTQERYPSAFGTEKEMAGVAGMTAVAANRTPVYFLSHGGPNVMYEHDHPAYAKLQQIGKEVTTKVKPKAVVVFSAHWQAGKSKIEVNEAEMTELIYDFYGFPSHYYKEKYPNVGSKEVANKVIQKLRDAGIEAEGVKRGLDHGVWAGFKCAFEPDANPLKVPIVQVSLFNSESPSAHYAVGRALASLRSEGILIITSGMAVHNLRDLRFTWGDPTPLPYTASFDEALRQAVETDPEEREGKMEALLKRGDARQAHPTFDHLLPIFVGAGAAGGDRGKRLWTLGEGSMSWAQYRFGNVGAGNEA
ncbi:MAG: hypothetical protein M1819_004130 [Sarea resinae]|nr:MAG: hypothetical protein M1819_004130 [Sarea resinae]